jgi:hypothetical protein
MKKFILIWTLTVLGTLTSFGQDIKRCDIAVLGQIDRNIENLKEKEIKDFLLTFDTSCNNNVEYSEFSNELLFKILDKHTLTILTVLESKEKNLKTDKILYELSSPINDSFNIDELISKVEKVKINEELKGQVIAKLKEAKGKL